VLELVSPEQDEVQDEVQKESAQELVSTAEEQGMVQNH
jgi:hypothetical protein